MPLRCFFMAFSWCFHAFFGCLGALCGPQAGGFDMLGSGRHKIESQEQFSDSMTVRPPYALHKIIKI